MPGTQLGLQVGKGKIRRRKITAAVLALISIVALSCQSTDGENGDGSGDAPQDQPGDEFNDLAGGDSDDVLPGDETAGSDGGLDIIDTLPPPNGAIIIDHTSVALFDLIPAPVIEQAAGIPSLFIHASVGGTIGTGLDCLSGALDQRAYCESISDPRYDRSRWIFQPHENGGCMGKLQDLVSAVGSQPDFLVYHQKFCYFEGLDELGSNCCGSPPAPETTEENFDTYAATMNELEAGNPGKIFIWWTTPYVQGQGQVCANDWNNRMRAYAREHGKVLFDIGDIETCSPEGNPTYADGLEAAFPPYCGEETGPSCHPTFPREGSGPDGGNVRLAKAWWVMMALLSGWEP